MRKFAEMCLFTLVALGVVLIMGALNTKVFNGLGVVNAALGFMLLASLSGISKYDNFFPGTVVALVFGFHRGGGFQVIIELVPLLLAMIYYKTLLHFNPRSPLNVYKSSALGALSHAVFTCFYLQLPLSFILAETCIAMLVVKSIVNILREQGLINHEDPQLVARLERDYLSKVYEEINKVFKTNLQRPVKPRKGEN